MSSPRADEMVFWKSVFLCYGHPAPLYHASCGSYRWGPQTRNNAFGGPFPPRGPSDRHTANIFFGGLSHIVAHASSGTGRIRLRSKRFATCLGFRTYDSSAIVARTVMAGRLAGGSHIAKGNRLAV